MNNCTICLKEELSENDIYTTDCNHIFCNKCLDDWFKRGNESCPLCRSKIDIYIYKGENYRLIIHKVERNNQISLNDLIAHNAIIRNNTITGLSLICPFFRISGVCGEKQRNLKV